MSIASNGRISARQRWPLLRLALLFCLLNVGLLALELARHDGFGPNRLAVEAMMLTGVFGLLAGRRIGQWLAVLGAILATALLAMALADALARYSLNRPLNLGLDLALVASVFHLIAGNVSVIAAWLATLLVAALLLLIACAICWLLRRLPARVAVRSWTGAIAVLLLLAGLVGLLGRDLLPNPPRTITPALTMLQDQVHWVERTRQERAEFGAMLQRRDDAGTRQAMTGLAEIDVVVGFIESYGVSAVFDERYAPVVLPQLESLEERAGAAGLSLVSGTVNAPVFGGQSWLAHATFLTGLWIDSQLRYELLQQTRQDTLVDDFAASGHHTAALMPAITMPWPEGRWYGFDTLLEAADFPYAGPPFNWVTMPDQYTWSHFQETVRAAAPRPLFAQLALISSHAPWVPIVPVIEDWSSIGDGEIFNQWEGKGETPASLWRDHDRVREHFARSVAYSLEVSSSYVAEFPDRNTLLILIGDHQPARMITGPDPSAGVPVHVISADPARLEIFRKRGFVDGGVPPDEFTDHSMADIRSWLQETFGGRGLSTAD